ncbi:MULTISPECIES: hypothetical protein [Cetobacterium]|jgi:hypothetical protein|uniref:DUF304 domain-containing protein n=1 Tax=Candidatus Cetobacterium colombiensis TaxID=3073100 RepID=A0ABU4W9F6_9FUSO|nr:hypothetical protein [Candidatus Cetobacterium colombiensis]MDX8335765.1 hypothetical protein [Candidatus Cetobacterium colombiensis]
MFFFEDFIKKINRTNVEYKPLRKYTLEAKKKIVWLGTGVPLVLIGVLQGYMGYTKNFSIPYLAIACLLLFLGFKHLRNIFMYKVVLDCENKKILGKDLDLSFDNIDSCQLKEAVVGKGSSIQVIIRIVTKDRKEVIIPLIMGNKINFICVLRDELKDKFSIIKG